MTDQNITPIIGITGPREVSTRASSAIMGVVRYIHALKCRLAVGCATGVDAWALAESLRQSAQRTTVFAAFGPKGEKSFTASNVSGVQRATAVGANVMWWSGGQFDSNNALRLIRRSQALVKYVASGPKGSGMFSFVSRPPPKGFAKDKAWPSCGSGTWGTLAAANHLSVPVLVFPIDGMHPGTLPTLPGKAGEWTQVLQGSSLIDAYMWMAG